MTAFRIDVLKTQSAMCDPLAIITQPTRNWTRLSLITAITLLFTTSENDHLHTGVGAISKKKWRPKNSALISRILRIIFATISDSAPKEESDTGSAATNSSLTGSGGRGGHDGRCPADVILIRKDLDAPSQPKPLLTFSIKPST
jgi:hypothetical protein